MRKRFYVTTPPPSSYQKCYLRAGGAVTTMIQKRCKILEILMLIDFTNVNVCALCIDE